MAYRHVVFDVDGTLIDTEHAVLTSLQKTLRTVLGREFALDELRFVLGITGADAFKQLGITDMRPGLDLWEEQFNALLHTVSLFDGVETLLQTLRERGIKLGIVTSKFWDEFEADLVLPRIAHYFDVVVCADDTEEHKPAPAPLLKYIEQAGAEKCETLYVGDSVYDMQCAAGAGVDRALAVWGCYAPARIEADYYPEKPEDVLTLL